MTRTQAIATAVAGVLATASLAACQKPAAPAAEAAPDTAKIADAVKGNVKGLVDAFNAHDVQKAVGYDAADYVGMFHGLPNVVGPEQDLALTKQQAGDPAAKVTVSDETVDVARAGDMAVYRATYDYAFTDPKTKKPTTEHGNWLLGWKAQPDGSWKLAWGVVSDAPAAAAPTAAASAAAPEKK